MKQSDIDDRQPSASLAINKAAFGKDFIWGVSTAAFQIEGAHDLAGKGVSIWDTFTSRKGKIKNEQDAKVACDFYHRFREDIDLVKTLNIPNFRFSISWTRILPNGTGQINQAGIDYYLELIDYCHELGIVPWVTLYHWDLPQTLEDKGGWTNRESIEWFADYVAVCARCFSSRVKHWIIANEPAVFTGAGYFLGIHAPGRKGLKNFLPAVHHSVLGIAEAARKLKEILPDSIVGNTFSCSSIEPYSDNPKDVEAARKVDVLYNRLFIEPLLGMYYPIADLKVLKKIEKYVLPGDREKLAFDFDFIGIQNYTREVVKYSLFMPYLNASIVEANKRKVPFTTMGWEIYPEGIYKMIKKFNSYPQIKKLYITENGAAFEDTVEGGRIHDDQRKTYLQNYISEILKAKNEGLMIDGYFVWTLTDNFEWAEGYHPRFGLVHIDFLTQKRIIKDSAYWYADFLKG